ncbi:MAG: DUF1570 domain-containing protein [Pirellulales bacterium]
MQIISGFRRLPGPCAARLAPWVLLLAWLMTPAARALEHITLRQGDGQRTVSGQLVVTAEDGGVLLLSADGTLWAIEPDDLIARRADDRPFEPLSRDELARQLLQELPEGFEVHTTRNYLICYNTSREYAAWCGALFERLYKGFTNYWSRKGMTLVEPRFPLVAIVFNSRRSYVDYSRAELGEAAGSIVGYYSLRTNRVTMYDLTGIESLRAAGDRRASASQINHMLARPEAGQAVATVVHEATHQIAFNSGLQTRFADVPLWVSEGIAVYFETPDLESARGWRTIGAVNTGRLAQFRRYLAGRPSTSLKTLLSDDKRIRDTRTALDAYAEAWALNYYLLHHHPRQYVAYLQMLSQKRELLWDDPQSRLKEFQAAFGENLGELDADFLRQMQKVR